MLRLEVGNKGYSQSLCNHGQRDPILDKTLPMISVRRNDELDTRIPHSQCEILLTDICDVACKRKPSKKEAIAMHMELTEWWRTNRTSPLSIPRPKAKYHSSISVLTLVE